MSKIHSSIPFAVAVIGFCASVCIEFGIPVPKPHKLVELEAALSLLAVVLELFLTPFRFDAVASCLSNMFSTWVSMCLVCYVFYASAMWP